MTSKEKAGREKCECLEDSATLGLRTPSHRIVPLAEILPRGRVDIGAGSGPGKPARPPIPPGPGTRSRVEGNKRAEKDLAPAAPEVAPLFPPPGLHRSL